MILRKIYTGMVVAMLAVVALSSCIEDAITTSASDQPYFSTDTVRMGQLFTLDASPTFRFTVYNRHDKGLNLSSIRFADDADGIFRMNVDGMSGREFSNVEIRANDSIFVFVEATLPENGRNVPVDVLSHIEFRCNGVSTSLPVKAEGRDAVRLKGDVRYKDGTTTLDPAKPYLVADSLVVEEGATLVFPAGTEMLFHSGAEIVVYGSLRIEGTPEKPVALTGDRTGYVASSIPYEIMSGQWGGIYFAPSSSDNSISHASIRNSDYGLLLDHAQGAPALQLTNSQVRNTKGYIVEAIYSSVTAAGCELADASMGILHLVGGNHLFNQCTIANYYLFTALGGPAVQLAHTSPDDADLTLEVEEGGEMPPFMEADFTNCIIYGNGTEVNHPDLTGTLVTFTRCLLKSEGNDDDNFIACLWGEDPLYHTRREEYLFDYTLQEESPARGAAFPDLILPQTATDMLGNQRLPDPALGAYQF